MKIAYPPACHPLTTEFSPSRGPIGACIVGTCAVHTFNVYRIACFVRRQHIGRTSTVWAPSSAASGRSDSVDLTSTAGTMALVSTELSSTAPGLPKASPKKGLPTSAPAILLQLLFQPKQPMRQPRPEISSKILKSPSLHPLPLHHFSYYDCCRPCHRPSSSSRVFFLLASA